MDELSTLASHYLEDVRGGSRTGKPPGQGSSGGSEAPTPLPSPLPQLSPAPPAPQIGQISPQRAS